MYWFGLEYPCHLKGGGHPALKRCSFRKRFIALGYSGGGVNEESHGVSTMERFPFWEA